MKSLRTAVIIGSTREGRAGEGVATWCATHATGRSTLDVDLVDLAAYSFPERHPRSPTPAMTALTGRLAVAEAFVVVTPEYNRSFPAALKQAIDFAYDEWHAKPVGFVSYGCASTGLYAVEQLRGVFAGLHTVTMRDAVGIDLLRGGPGDADLVALDTLLDHLTWWGLALRDARELRGTP
ncbi:NADPH-dependent FMN reductase [Nonomuraea sp. NPDC050663]|uniref:NADPH-dependent FMN reductase n=1 Tax=Nonomuraea sp. NPDC050663 TaxID=3364370 RepID=UPI003795A865